jgi:hypothetical protein
VQDHWNENPALGEHPDQVNPGHPRHANIKNDDIGWDGLANAQRFFTISCDGNAISDHLQLASAEFPDGLVVVDEKNGLQCDSPGR